MRHQLPLHSLNRTNTFTLEVIEPLVKYNSCARETVDALLKTPAMKRHVAEIHRKFHRLGFDVRTNEQKAEEERQKEQYRRWALNSLMSRYPREKLYEEICGMRE